MVDRGLVTFVATKSRAEELAGSRFLSYLLICELARTWKAHSGYENLQVHLAYVPAFRELLVFAAGVMTDVGVRVVMSS